MPKSRLATLALAATVAITTCNATPKEKETPE